MQGRDLRHLTQRLQSSSKNTPEDGDGGFVSLASRRRESQEASPLGRSPSTPGPDKTTRLSSAPSSQKNSARDVAASGRQTNTEATVPVRPTIPDPEILEAADDGRLVDLAIFRALHGQAKEIDHEDDPPIDQVAREHGEAWVGEFATAIEAAELKLATLVGLFGERSLGSALVNQAAIKLGEAREQLPAMRQAVRDLEAGS